MALILCPECNAQVSDQARSCPHCGFPIAERMGTAANTAIPPAAVNTPAAPAVSSTEAMTIIASPNRMMQRLSLPFVLFWGGMIIGVMGSNVMKNLQHGGVEQRTLLGWIGWAMMFVGVALFAYKEIKAYQQRRLEELEEDRKALAAERAERAATEHNKPAE